MAQPNIFLGNSKQLSLAGPDIRGQGVGEGEEGVDEYSGKVLDK